MEHVLKAYTLNVTAALKINPTPPQSWRAMFADLPSSTQDLIFDSLSPSTRPCSQVAFFSTVVTTDDSCPYDRTPPWEELTKINRFASVSALRQLQSFHISAVIFGIIFRRSRVRMQVTWHRTPKGRDVNLMTIMITSTTTHSAQVYLSADIKSPVTQEPQSDEDEDSDSEYSDEEDNPIREWRLRNAQEHQEFSEILRRLNRYTSTTFTQKVSEGLAASAKSIQNGTWKAWKWPIEDDEYAKSNEHFNHFNSLHQVLRENWILGRYASDRIMGPQVSPNVYSMPSNSVASTEGPISTAATSSVSSEPSNSIGLTEGESLSTASSLATDRQENSLLDHANEDSKPCHAENILDWHPR
jgi:hypothetical protein